MSKPLPNQGAFDWDRAETPGPESVASKQCSRCKLSKPVSQFSRMSESPDGLQYLCRECRNAWDRAKRAMLAAAREPKTPQPDRPEAEACYQAVKRALKIGQIKKQPCAECGTTRDIRSFHRCYTKPYEIVWLCRKHHRAARVGHRYLGTSDVLRSIPVGFKKDMLEVVSPPIDENGTIKFRVKCDCGRTIVVTGLHLIGQQHSCGCLRRKDASRRSRKTHGGTRTRLYGIWSHMKNRCLSPTGKDYADYGGRGIQIHESWFDFAVFREWAYANSYDNTLTIERVDVNGNYEPSNCKWIPLNDQTKNRRTSLRIEAFGESRVASEWLPDPRCKAGSISAIYGRLKMGWDGEQAISTPAFAHNKLQESDYIEIVRRHNEGESSREIAADFGVSSRRIRYVVYELDA